MKRLYFLFTFAFICLSMSAETVETEKWTGNEAISWNSDIPGTQFETPSGTFSGLAEGDIIKIYTEVTGVEYGDPQYVVTYKAGSGWEWTDLAISFDNNVISYTVTEATVATEIADRGLILRGQNWTAKKITVTTSSVKSLWSGVMELGDWGQLESLRYEGKGALAYANVNDVIRITFVNALEDCYLGVCDAGTYSEFENGSFNPAASAEAQTVQYVVTASTVESIREKGIVVKGKYATLTSVELDYATAIGEIKSDSREQKADGIYYNLQGQRVEKPVKGVYIKNGKKVLFR
jgi:hypothetical protein